MSGPARTAKSARTLHSRRLYFVYFTSYLGWRDNPVLEGKSLVVCNWTLAVYAIHLSYGHTILCKSISAATIKQYVLAAASLIAQFRTDTIDPRCHSATSKEFAPCLDGVFKELIRYEKVPNRREPLTMEMIECLYQRNKQACHSPTHLFVLLYHWFVIGLALGFRRIEWCQEASSANSRPALSDPQIDHRDNLPRAFLLRDIQCFSCSKARIPLVVAVSSPHLVDSISIKWRFQKNNENGEEKLISRSTNSTRATHCRVESLLAILRTYLVLISPTIDPEQVIPLAVFQSDSGAPTYITNWDVTGMLRSLAAEVYNLNPSVKTDQEQLRRWSCHSIRVGACVLLHAMGFSATDIQFLLRWKSDAFMAYLRNLSFLSRRHADAIDRAAAIPNFI